MLPIIRACERQNFEYFILHTGQHYSYTMVRSSSSSSNYQRQSTIWDTNTQAFILEILTKETVLEEEMTEGDKNIIRTILEEGQGD